MNLLKRSILGVLILAISLFYSCDDGVVSKNVKIDSDDLEFVKLELRRDFNETEFKYYWWLDCEVENTSKIDSYSLSFDLVVLNKDRILEKIPNGVSPIISRKSNSSFSIGFSSTEKVNDFQIENIEFKVNDETGVKMNGEQLPSNIKNFDLVLPD